MKYIETLRENTHISEVYLCQQKAIYLTKSGKVPASATSMSSTMSQSTRM